MDLLREGVGVTLLVFSFLFASFCYCAFVRHRMQFKLIAVVWLVLAQVAVNLGIGFLLPYGMAQFTLARWLWF